MGNDSNKLNVSLRIADESELEKFKIDLQDAFKASAEKDLGNTIDEPIPSDDDIEGSFRSDGAIIYHVLANGVITGGAIVSIDEETQHNKLLLFFIKTSQHDRGIGHKAWKVIEKKHPKTKSWETVTPYFEKRNIHFYVNKCGFKIVNFYNKYNHDPNNRSVTDYDEDDEMFKFKKNMEQLLD